MKGKIKTIEDLLKHPQLSPYWFKVTIEDDKNVYALHVNWFCGEWERHKRTVVPGDEVEYEPSDESLTVKDKAYPMFDKLTLVSGSSTDMFEGAQPEL